MSWYRDALERVAVPDLIPELNPQEGPAYFTVTCPSCGEHDAFIYKNNLSRITCNHKNSCGASVAVYDYLIGREGSKKAAYDFIPKNDRQKLIRKKGGKTCFKRRSPFSGRDCQGPEPKNI